MEIIEIVDRYLEELESYIAKFEEHPEMTMENDYNYLEYAKAHSRRNLLIDLRRDIMHEIFKPLLQKEFKPLS